MTAPITRIAPDFALLKKTGFDNIIDVRSPSEFLDDHMPGAINPVSYTHLTLPTTPYV